MGDAVLRLPAVPEQYNVRDQAEMRRSIESAIAKLDRAPSTSSSLVFTVSDYLKRPATTHRAALQAAIDDAVEASRVNAPSNGGVTGDVPTVDLEGRTWTLDDGVDMDRNTGIVIQNGTLLAASTFPTTSFLLSAGTRGTNYSDGFKVVNLRVLNVNFRNEHRGGGMYLAYGLRTRIWGCNFFGYSTIGLHVAVDGHEAYLESLQFGEHVWADSVSFNDPSTYTGTGCKVDTNDNHITNVVIQLSKIGLHITKTSNLITNLHVWTGFKVVAGVVTNTQGVYLAANAYYNTFVNCYFDTCEVLIENPWETAFANCYFLHGQNVTTNAFFRFKAVGSPNFFHGIRITGCVFRGIPVGGDPTMKMIQFDESTGNTFAYAQVTNCRIIDNSFSGCVELSTHKRVAISNEPGVTWTFFFGNLFGIGVIQTVLMSSYQYAGPTANATFAITSVTNDTVVVTASGSCTATVYLDVDVNQPDALA